MIQEAVSDCTLVEVTGEEHRSAAFHYQAYIINLDRRFSG